MSTHTAAVIVVALCAAGAARADRSFDALTSAAIRGDVAHVDYLLATGADPNRETWLGLTPMTAAMRSCEMSVEILQLLIAFGADIEARSGVGATPLMLAWRNGRPDLAEVLVMVGADVSARNDYGDTAAEYEAFYKGDLPASAFATLRYTSHGFASADAPACG